MFLTFARHPIARFGIALATGSALVFLVVLALDVAGQIHNPYASLIIFLALPAVLVVALALIPLGVWLDKRRAAIPLDWPYFDLRDPRRRRVVWLVSILTLVNVALLGVATRGAVEYMETDAFCGQACHTVMEPQFTAHQVGPHANVSCVTCHIGDGTRSFVEAKLRGLNQLRGFLADDFLRPIRPRRVDSRTTSESCTQCHSLQPRPAARLRIDRTYRTNEASTERSTTLRLHVGGLDVERGRSHGIHWHADPDIDVSYVAPADDDGVIPYVKVTDRDGRVTEYVTQDGAADARGASALVKMGCLDCHSRPAHALSASAEAAIDRALNLGQLERSLPYVKREAVAALTAEFEPAAAAEHALGIRFRDFYTREYADLATAKHDELLESVGALRRLYAQSVFPDMNVEWGTYARQIGHTEAPGCFRCHDDNHVSPTGAVIRQDCALCHGFE